MRGTLLIAASMIALALSGCLVDDADGSDGSPNTGAGTDSAQGQTNLEPGTKVEAGDALGTLTFADSGTTGAASVETGCETTQAGRSNLNDGSTTFGWNIPTTGDGVPWRIETLSITVTRTNPSAGDLDFFVTDSSGNELGRATEPGPETEDARTLTLTNIAAGPLTIEVVPCASAMGTFDVDGAADMVASEAATVGASGTSTGTTSGNVQVERRVDGNGDIYFVASRTETYRATLSGSTGTFDASTGAGSIDVKAVSGSKYELVARLQARADSEQDARNRLAEMYIDHQETSGAAVVVEAHGEPGGNGQWSKKQIDLTMETPSAIDWTRFQASTSAGSVDVEGIEGQIVDLSTSAGSVDASNIEAGTLKLRTSAGSIDVDSSTADTLEAKTSAGSIDVSSSKAGDLDLQASAGRVDADMKASAKSGTWSLKNSAGSIELTVDETSSIGYDVSASTSAGSVNFNFNDFQETSSDCKYSSCSREGQTNGYDSRSIKVDVTLRTSAGSISAGS